MFQLTFLGTSAGIPTKQRNVTALAVACVNPYLNGDNQRRSRPWVLIDCGEATQHQLLKTPLSGHQLVAICITHVHGDHCYGLPGLLASLAMSGRRSKLTIIAPQAISQLIDSVTLTTDLHLTYPIQFIAIENLLAKQPLSEQLASVTLKFSATHQLTVGIVPLSHRVPSHAFVLTQSLSTIKLATKKLQAAGIPASKVWGQLQRGEDVQLADGQWLKSVDFTDRCTSQTKIVVAGDNDRPELLAKAVSDATLMVHEATYTDEVQAKIQAKIQKNSSKSACTTSKSSPVIDPMHSSAGQVARFAAKSGVPNLILTHFSARYQLFDNISSATANLAHIRLDVDKAYSGNYWLAQDFDQFEVGESVRPLNRYK